MDPTEVFIWVSILVAPGAVVVIVGLLRGYHLWFHLYRGDSKKKKRRY